MVLLNKTSQHQPLIPLILSLPTKMKGIHSWKLITLNPQKLFWSLDLVDNTGTGSSIYNDTRYNDTGTPFKELTEAYLSGAGLGLGYLTHRILAMKAVLLLHFYNRVSSILFWNQSVTGNYSLETETASSPWVGSESELGAGSESDGTK